MQNVIPLYRVKRVSKAMNAKRLSKESERLLGELASACARLTELTGSLESEERQQVDEILTGLKAPLIVVSDSLTRMSHLIAPSKLHVDIGQKICP
jgi:hypothetical protein